MFLSESVCALRSCKWCVGVLSQLFVLSDIKFEMGVHWKDLGVIVLMLSVFASCAARINGQSSVRNGLLFLDVGVWCDWVFQLFVHLKEKTSENQKIEKSSLH